MPFSKVILKHNNNKLPISKRKFVGGKVHYQQKALEQPIVKTQEAVNRVAKQISDLHINKRKPITLKL